MHCPACKNTELLPTTLENGLIGHGCSACGGVLVSVLAARKWAEAEPECSWNGHVEPAAETSTALTCPKCARFMSKFRIDAGVSNRLDSCGHCGEFWLDAGEWALLGALELRGKLPAIFSQPWQVSLRDQEAAQARQQRLQAALGAEDHARVQAFAEWLKTHPQAALIRRQLANN